MPDFTYHEMFPLEEDTTAYRALTTEHVGLEKFNGTDILTVEGEGLTKLAAQAFYDSAHFLRPGHLKQLASILEGRFAQRSFRRLGSVEECEHRRRRYPAHVPGYRHRDHHGQ